MRKFLAGEATVPIVAVLSVGATVILAATAFFFSTTSELSARLGGVQEINTTQTASIATNSAMIKALDERLDHMDKQLDRIESKITGQPLSKIENQ